MIGDQNEPIEGATIAFDAKELIFERLATEADGGLLNAWDVSYDFDASAGLNSIYGGGWRSLQQVDAVPEEPGMLVLDIVEVSVYLSCTIRPPVDLLDADREVKAAARVMAGLFSRNRRIAGMTWLSIARGQADYNRTDQETNSRAAFAMQVTGYCTWRTS